MENAIPVADAALNFATPLRYSDLDLMVKVNDYVPPMKDTLKD